MHTKTDLSHDRVVSLDAFKVTRHDEGRRWHVKPLVPWARDMLKDQRTSGLVQSNRGYPLKGPDSSLIVPTHPFRFGVGFGRLGDALDFLRELENREQRWTA